MNTPQLLLLSLALSADAFVVSLCRGLRGKSAIATASAFGFFQAGMPVAGWIAGSAFRGVLDRAASWVAFGILTTVGARMIWKTLTDGKNGSCPTGDGFLLALAFATSLDAFAAGISLSLIRTSIWVPALVIGVVTFAVCLAGSGIGVAAGIKLGNRLELAAGVVMIALGVKALFP
jgi:putative Mn2+ efflux pump MntP